MHEFKATAEAVSLTKHGCSLVLWLVLHLFCQPTALYIITLNRNLKLNSRFAVTIRMAVVRGNTDSGYSWSTLQVARLASSDV